jgi:serine/threonine-protein kinase
LAITEHLIGQLLAGRYRVDELVARGGMSEVYRGWDVRLDRRVAIKVLAGRLAADRDAVRRMEREARAVAQLGHPNVVAVYDHGEEADGTPFLVMEWIEGRSLKEVVAGGALPEAEARRITLQLLAALEHAHDHGIVHRDIKPQNVLMAPDGTAKLTDFGIARSVDATSGLTMAGQIVGTAAYLSPEQAKGQPVTAASDVYSVGAVLFELVTGRPPYAADTAMATALMHVDDPVPDVRSVRRRPSAGRPDWRCRRARWRTAASRRRMQR